MNTFSHKGRSLREHAEEVSWKLLLRLCSSAFLDLETASDAGPDTTVGCQPGQKQEVLDSESSWNPRSHLSICPSLHLSTNAVRMLCHFCLLDLMQVPPLANSNTWREQNS